MSVSFIAELSPVYCCLVCICIQSGNTFIGGSFGFKSTHLWLPVSSIVVPLAQISFLLQLKLKVIVGWNPMCFINFVIVRNICVSFSTYGATWEEGPQRWVNGSMGQELQTELKYIFVNCACFE